MRRYYNVLPCRLCRAPMRFDEAERMAYCDANSLQGTPHGKCGWHSRAVKTQKGLYFIHAGVGSLIVNPRRSRAGKADPQ